MKTKTTNSVVVSVIAAFIAAIFLAGCAEMESNNTKSLLSAAGFHVRTPETPLQKEIYGTLTNHRVERVSAKGKVVYVFKDQESGVAYVGREPEYQRYQHLCVEQKIAQEYYMAVQMERTAAYRWYGTYGYRGWY
ncbi:MAG TPA: hypothetical protein VGM62_16045 [Chthoniobacterales bacterium]|jgi:hypothetical protein